MSCLVKQDETQLKRSMAKGYQVRQFLKQYNQEEADEE